MPAKNQDQVIGSIKKRDDVEIRATLAVFRNEHYIDIREYVESESYTGPTKKGIRFHVENWEDFQKLIAQIDDVLKKTL